MKTSTKEGNAWALRNAWAKFWTAGGVITPLVLYYLSTVPGPVRDAVLAVMREAAK